MASSKSSERNVVGDRGSPRDGRPVASRQMLTRGTVIPAHPLALDKSRKLDERRQRALSRYYITAGAGGLAVGVHTTQFLIHDPKVGLLQPVLAIAAEEMDHADGQRQETLVRVAGICGSTDQALREAEMAQQLGYHLGLLNLNALSGTTQDRLIDHCRTVSELIPLFGFYLQEKAGGVELPCSFWRRFCDIENVAAIKIAAFDRYRTIDVVRAVAETGRDDIALYTGNDDNIVLDLLTPYRFDRAPDSKERRIVGGLLGHWAVWTKQAVDLLKRCHELVAAGGDVPENMVRLAVEVTDANAAIFDAANGFRGCVPGILEILKRQGLLAGNWCLDENEVLSPGQADQIDRVCAVYPQMTDDAFVAEHLEEWLSG